VLVSLAEALLGDDEAALDVARITAHRALGPAGLSDAVAVIGLFNAIDRVADATGIPLEPDKAAASADFRAALGLDRFAVVNRG
jgi:hypothetical protein